MASGADIIVAVRSEEGRGVTGQEIRICTSAAWWLYREFLKCRINAVGSYNYAPRTKYRDQCAIEDIIIHVSRDLSAT